MDYFKEILTLNICPESKEEVFITRHGRGNW